MSVEWYHAVGSQQSGPFERGEILQALERGEVRNDTLVWKSGMADWLPISQVPEFANAEVGQVYASSSAQGAAPQIPGASSQPPPNYLWQSIVCTILCCWPLGIPAIVFAAKVDGMYQRGDFAGAAKASQNAKTWCWVAFGAGIAVFVVAFLTSFWRAGSN